MVSDSDFLAKSVSPFGKPGPFQIIENESLDSPCEAPKRRHLCSHYETCLNLAAAFNWDNFTCRGCSGEINQTLLWRAHQEMRKDKIIRKICPNLPEPGCIDNIQIPEVTFPALRLVGKR